MPIYQLVAKATLRAQEVRNIFHYETTSELAFAQLQQAADLVRAAWVSLDDSANLVNEFVLYGMNARRVDVGNLPETQLTFTGGNFSGSVNDTPAVPNQVALLVSGSAPTVFPRRVRTYLAGFAQSGITDGGFWDAARTTDAATWVAAMDELTVTGDTLQRVAVRYSGSPLVTSAWNRITTYSVKSNPATQRRRRIGIGI